ncbi:MAG: hypothetical protein UHN47_04970 [Lachnospiraceae bacterium]|nr:hypothetical protein [Lachnospiraceae bacterium]
MAKTTQDIIKFIQEQDIKMVDFKIVDINGQFRHSKKYCAGSRAVYEG